MLQMVEDRCLEAIRPDVQGVVASAAILAARASPMVLAPAIDALFVLLGEAPGHCRRNVETAFLGLPPTS